MRPLNEEETKIFFEKLANYIGPNVKFLIDNSEDPYVFRLIGSRVYYMREEIFKLACHIGKDDLLQ